MYVPRSDPLVVKGIKWTIVDNLVDTRYILKQVRRYYGTEQNNWILRVIEGIGLLFVVIPRQGSSNCTSSSVLKSKPSAIPVSKGELFKLLGFLLSLTRTHSKLRDLFCVCDTHVLIPINGFFQYCFLLYH